MAFIPESIQQPSRRTTSRMVVPSWVRLLPLGMLIVPLFAGIMGMHVASHVSARAVRDVEPPAAIENVSLQIQSIENDTASARIAWDPSEESDLFSYRVVGRSLEAQKPFYEAFVGDVSYVDIQVPTNAASEFIVSAQDTSNNERSSLPLLFHPPSIKTSNSVHVWAPVSFDQDRVRASLEQNSDIWSVVSPFQFDVQEDGSLAPQSNAFSGFSESLTGSASIVPTITNANSPAATVTRLFESRESAIQHANVVADTMLALDVDGVDINYESVGVSVRSGYSAFIQQLSSRLKDQNRLLSVTMQPRISVDGSRIPSAVDAAFVSRYADFVRVMAYDAARVSTSPGSVAPLPWVQRVTEDILLDVPEEKLVVGLPLYGYDWCEGVGEGREISEGAACASEGLTWERAHSLLREGDQGSSSVQITDALRYDAASQSATFGYIDANGFARRVWFEDAETLMQKWDAVQSLGVSQVVFWRVGGEDAAVWSSLRRSHHAYQPLIPEGVRVTSGNQSLRVQWSSSVRDVSAILVWDDSNTLVRRIEDISASEDVLIEDLENGEQYGISFSSTHQAGALADLSALKAGTLLEALSPDVQNSVRPLLQAYAVDTMPPPAIDELKIDRIASTFADISWTIPLSVEEGDSYQLFIGAADSFSVHTAYQLEHTPPIGAPGEVQSMRVRGFVPGDSYIVGMRLVDSSQNTSSMSAPVNITTKDILPPPPPKDVRAIVGDGSLHVMWSPSFDASLEGYSVHVIPERGPAFVRSVDAEQQSLWLRDMENGVLADIWVTAVDRSGNESARSEVVTVAPGDPSLRDSASGLWGGASSSLLASAADVMQFLIRPETLPYVAMTSIGLLNIWLFRAMKNDLTADTWRRRFRSMTSSGGRKPQLAHAGVSDVLVPLEKPRTQHQQPARLPAPTTRSIVSKRMSSKAPTSPSRFGARKTANALSKKQPRSLRWG